MSDQTRSYEKTSTVGVVLAVVGFFFLCFLSLLFLLMKEHRVEGFILVTVEGPGFAHTTSIAVASPTTVVEVTHSVNYARTLSG